MPFTHGLDVRAFDPPTFAGYHVSFIPHPSFYLTLQRYAERIRDRSLISRPALRLVKGFAVGHRCKLKKMLASELLERQASLRTDGG